VIEAAIHVKPFGFDRVFHMAGSDAAPLDAHTLGERIEGLRARIASMEEVHREELAIAGADGFARGLDQARQERDAALLAAADAIHAAIEQIDARFADTAEAMAHDAAEVALAAADMIAGHAVAAAPVRAIAEALDRVLRQVARGTQLAIRVHPALADAIGPLVEPRGSERRRVSLAVLPDAALTVGDAVIFWDEGGLAIDAAARRQGVMAELQALLVENPAG
jgi:flagellar assembly protein FliH